MGLSKLSVRCQACPFVDTCDNKEMEARGYLPLPEPAAQSTEKMLIGSEGGEMVSVNGEIDVDELVRTLIKEFQLPNRSLNREFRTTKAEEQWQKFLEINGLR